jgi:hypothetical protein
MLIVRHEIYIKLLPTLTFTHIRAMLQSQVIPPTQYCCIKNHFPPKQWFLQFRHLFHDNKNILNRWVKLYRQLCLLNVRSFAVCSVYAFNKNTAEGNNMDKSKIFNWSQGRLLLHVHARTPPFSLSSVRKHTHTHTHSEMLIPLSLALLTSVQWETLTIVRIVSYQKQLLVLDLPHGSIKKKKVLSVKITLSLYINTAGSGVLQCPCIFYISVTNSEAHTLFPEKHYEFEPARPTTHESRRLYSNCATDKNHTYWHMGNVMTTDLYHLFIH